MVVVTRKHLQQAAKKYPDAASEIAAWFAIVHEARWLNFLEVRAVFPDADSVDGYVVFNFRHNRYRLITVLHYAKQGGEKTRGHAYIRSFLTHKQYETRANWDKEYGH